MFVKHLPVLLALPLMVAAVSAAPHGTPANRRQSGNPSSNPFSAPLETPHLSVRLSTSSAAAAPGAVVSLFVDVSPKPRMHVYAPDQKDYIPIALTLQPDETLRPAPPRYPKPEKYFFAPLKETQLVYSAPFRIAQDVTLVSTPALVERARAGTPHTIAGTLRYQACDDTICYMPKNLAVSWSIRVKP